MQTRSRRGYTYGRRTQRPPGLTQNQRSPNIHFGRTLALTRGHNSTRRPPREGRKNENWREREKKGTKFWATTLRAPNLQESETSGLPPTSLGSGSPSFEPPPFGPSPPRAENEHTEETVFVLSRVFLCVFLYPCRFFIVSRMSFFFVPFVFLLKKILLSQRPFAYFVPFPFFCPVVFFLSRDRNHRTSTPNRSETNDIAERAACRT